MTNSKWIAVSASDDLPEGTAWPASVEGKAICLYRVDSKVYATSDFCTHGDANLSGGLLEGHEIECPFHQGRFDVRTGEATKEPCVEPVKIYRAREDGGTIYVDAGDEA